jgi:hypothetical protein
VTKVKNITRQKEVQALNYLRSFTNDFAGTISKISNFNNYTTSGLLGRLSVYGQVFFKMLIGLCTLLKKRDE